MAHVKNICILGSTGSIGRSSLEVIAQFPERFRVASLTANRSIDLLQKQVERFKPDSVAVLDDHCAARLKHSVDGSVEVLSGMDGLLGLIDRGDTDIVINSMVGFAGLAPTIAAIKQGKTIAIANKETLVVAGEIITRLVKKHNARLVPIDSEHSAILQCLAGERPENISRLILTASGGPFLNLAREKFKNVTIDEALNHPKWKMGSKITIDSATLMNKGLEVIEAHWLFGLPSEKIEVLIHPQSIVHSMVEFVDGSVKAQLGVPDMKIPIQYALTYPDRAASNYHRVNFAELRSMTFLPPDMEKFECLRLAYDALNIGGTAPTILNAANEVAVEMFLRKQIAFDKIPRLIHQAMQCVPVKQAPTLDEVVETDSASREATKRFGREAID